MNKENLIDKLHEADMLNLVLVSLFSADTLVDAESCRKSLEALAIQVERLLLTKAHCREDC